MKIRAGYVSNSSSSSFVGFTTVEQHEKALSQLTQEERDFVTGLTFQRIDKFGKTFVKLEEYQTEDTYYIQNADMFELLTDGEDYDDIYDKVKPWDKYIKILQASGNILEHSEGC